MAKRALWACQTANVLYGTCPMGVPHGNVLYGTCPMGVPHGNVLYGSALWKRSMEVLHGRAIWKCSTDVPRSVVIYERVLGTC